MLILLTFLLPVALATPTTFTCDENDPTVTCTSAGDVVLTPEVPYTQWRTLGTVTGAAEVECPQGEGAQLRIRPNGVVQGRALPSADTTCELLDDNQNVIAFVFVPTNDGPLP